MRNTARNHSCDREYLYASDDVSVLTIFILFFYPVILDEKTWAKCEEQNEGNMRKILTPIFLSFKRVRDKINDS